MLKLKDIVLYFFLGKVGLQNYVIGAFGIQAI